MTVRRGLGRGLGALLPPAPQPHREPPSAAVAGQTRVPDPRDAPGEDGDGTASSGMRAARPDDGRTNFSGGAADRGTAGMPPAADGGRLVGPATPVAEAAPVPQEPGAYFAELSVDSVRANPRQPREVFDEEALQQLAVSLAQVGLLQPVVVRPAENGTFELVMGERRWRAAQLAGLEHIPAIVRHTGDGELLRDALLENLHRADLNPLEEAAAYQQLLDDFAVTQEELAARIGRSRPHISNTIRLLRLSPAVQRRVAAGVLSAGHARALLAIDDADRQDRLAARVVAEELSVRALEELVVAQSGAAGPSRPRLRSTPALELSEIAARLSERFETRCSVDLGRRRGKLVIEFATVEDLNRILAKMDSAHAVPGPRSAVDLST